MVRQAAEESVQRPSGFLSPYKGAGGDQDGKDEFEQRLELLTSILEAVELRSKALVQRASTAEQHSSDTAHRLRRAEDVATGLRRDSEGARERERRIAQENARLRAEVEALRQQYSEALERQHQKLAHERLRADRACASRDDALAHRDVALAELAAAYVDMETMQATLADSAVFVRYLRRRVTQLEQQGAEAAAAAELRAQEQQHRPDEDAASVFSIGAIRASIQHAVQEAAHCDEAERRRRLRALQLRWHPDKNPVLREVATEVTKIINEAITQLEGG